MHIKVQYKLSVSLEFYPLERKKNEIWMQKLMEYSRKKLRIWWDEYHFSKAGDINVICDRGCKHNTSMERMHSEGSFASVVIEINEITCRKIDEFMSRMWILSTFFSSEADFQDYPHTHRQKWKNPSPLVTNLNVYECIKSPMRLPFVQGCFKHHQLLCRLQRTTKFYHIQ